MPDDDLIPTTDAARILGVLPRSARSTLHRYGVKAAGYVTTGGRAVAQFRRADVERVAASRPGRGSRTDIRGARMPIVLTTIANQVNDLQQSPVEGRADRLAAMLPDLVVLAADERVAEETRINLLTKAARTVAPHTSRADTPDAALDAVRAAVAMFKEMKAANLAALRDAFGPIVDKLAIVAAEANVVDGVITVRADSEDTDIVHTPTGVLGLRADVEPWGSEEYGMERADAALADMGWSRVTDWEGAETSVTCWVRPADPA